MNVVSDEEILGGQPRIEGTRVGVRHVAARVVDAGQSPPHVADHLDLSLAEIYGALSYYYDNLDEIEAYERENEAAFEGVRELAARTGLGDRATFVQGNVYDAPAVLDERSEVVFTSYGVLGWLPDLDRWAQAAAAVTEPGGTFYRFPDVDLPLVLSVRAERSRVR